jgi:small subunit ribosomal protein S20
MPHTKSAKKRLRQSETRRATNRSTKRSLKTQIRKAGETAKPEDAQSEARKAAKQLDQAAAKHIIHKNAAARLKSRLSKKLKKAKTAG